MAATKKVLALCEARHQMPEAVEGSVFGNTLDPLDTEGLKAEASAALTGIQSLTLYVTGLTVALGAVVSVCAEQGIELTLMHFDRESGNYYPQKLW